MYNRCGGTFCLLTNCMVAQQNDHEKKHRNLFCPQTSDSNS